jgi:N-acetylmuramoyl-L-alanine amidase
MRKKRVCIDPGHGLLAASPRRFDPGAVSGQHREADIVLEYAAKLRDALSAAGHEVIATRASNDQLAPLLGRVPFARAAGADLLISLHCNGAESKQAHGIEVLYKQSKELAIDLQRATVAAIGLRDRGVKHRPLLAVLQFPGPCAMIELGFLTNDGDRAVMLNQATQARFAAAIVQALQEGDWA